MDKSQLIMFFEALNEIEMDSIYLDFVIEAMPNGWQEEYAEWADQTKLKSKLTDFLITLENLGFTHSQIVCAMRRYAEDYNG